MQTSEHFHAQRWMKPIYSGNNIWFSLRLVLELWWCVQIEWKVYLHLFFYLCKSDRWTVLINHKLPRDVTVEADSRSRLHRDLSLCETAQAVLRITSASADSIVHSWKEAHKDSGLSVKHFQLTQTLNLWHLHEPATSQFTLYAIARPPKFHFTFNLVLSRISIIPYVSILCIWNCFNTYFLQYRYIHICIFFFRNLKNVFIHSASVIQKYCALIVVSILPSGVEYRYFSRCCIKMRNSSIVTSLFQSKHIFKIHLFVFTDV